MCYKGLELQSSTSLVLLSTVAGHFWYSEISLVMRSPFGCSQMLHIFWVFWCSTGGWTQDPALLDKHFSTWATPPNLFALVIPQVESHFLHRLALKPKFLDPRPNTSGIFTCQVHKDTWWRGEKWDFLHGLTWSTPWEETEKALSASSAIFGVQRWALALNRQITEDRGQVCIVKQLSHRCGLAASYLELLSTFIVTWQEVHNEELYGWR
jgi:hypothetical protein